MLYQKSVVTVLQKRTSRCAESIPLSLAVGYEVSGLKRGGKGSSRHGSGSRESHSIPMAAASQPVDSTGMISDFYNSYARMPHSALMTIMLLNNKIMLPP